MTTEGFNPAPQTPAESFEQATETTSSPAATDEPVTLPVREHYDAIRSKEQAVRELETKFFEARRVAKNAKEEFEAADLELRNLIAHGFDPQTKLPFGNDEPAEDPDAWKSALLAELSLPDKLFDKLLTAGVETIGQLEDLRAEISEGKADWPKGIGTAKVTLIEDAVLAWLSAHRDHWGEPLAAA